MCGCDGAWGAVRAGRGQKWSLWCKGNNTSGMRVGSDFTARVPVPIEIHEIRCQAGGVSVLFVCRLYLSVQQGEMAELIICSNAKKTTYMCVSYNAACCAAWIVAVKNKAGDSVALLSWNKTLSQPSGRAGSSSRQLVFSQVFLSSFLYSFLSFQYPWIGIYIVIIVSVSCVNKTVRHLGFEMDDCIQSDLHIHCIWNQIPDLFQLQTLYQNFLSEVQHVEFITSFNIKS